MSTTLFVAQCENEIFPGELGSILVNDDYCVPPGTESSWLGWASDRAGWSQAPRNIDGAICSRTYHCQTLVRDQIALDDGRSCVQELDLLGVQLLQQRD